VFVFPQPSQEVLAKLYCGESEYHVLQQRDLATTSDAEAVALHGQLGRHGLGCGRLLDIGCGTGRLIYHMRRLGWDAVGIDINPDSAAVARENGLHVTVGRLDDYLGIDGGFDAIHMGDTIEHLSEPIQTLKIVHRLLRPGGLLTIETPNVRCGFAVLTLLVARALGSRWAYSEAPYHLYEYTAGALITLVQRAGFRLELLRCSGRRPVLYDVGASGFVDDLKRSLKRRQRLHEALPYWDFVKGVPGLTAALALVLPAHVLGALWDFAAPARRPRISVVARRTS